MVLLLIFLAGNFWLNKNISKHRSIIKSKDIWLILLIWDLQTYFQTLAALLYLYVTFIILIIKHSYPDVPIKI